jgi:hypothetical protein
MIKGDGWAPGPVWTDAENLSVTGFRSPDRPARSVFAIPIEISWMELLIKEGRSETSRLDINARLGQERELCHCRISQPYQNQIRISPPADVRYPVV